MDQSVSALFAAHPITFVIAVLVLVALSAIIVCWFSEYLPHAMAVGWREETLGLAADHPDWGLAPPKPIERATFALSKRHKGTVSALALALVCLAVFVADTVSMAIAYSILLLATLAIASINIKHYLIPDSLVQGLLWGGLVYHTIRGDDLSQYVLGATIAYVALHLLLAIVYRLIGKQLFGHGDIKAFAMLGAWFGLSQLPFLIAICVTALFVVNIALLIAFKNQLLERASATGIYYLLAAVVGVSGILSF